MFITLEGIEGSGKTTLIENLADVFRTLNHEVLVTREPGGCALGRELRGLLLNPETKISSEAELFLFLADRAQHVAEVIRPALDRGVVVLCDRYADSTVVYQGYGRGLDIERLRDLNDMAVGGLWPDRTFVLDMDPAAALIRARRRNAELGVAGKEIYGILNDPNLPAAITAGATGTGGSTKWADKTTVQIYNDVLALFAQLSEQSSGLIDKDTPLKLCLSPELAVRLGAATDFNVSVLDMLKRYFTRIDIVTVPELHSMTAGETMFLIAPEVNGQRSGTLPFGEKMRAGRVVPDLSSFRQKFVGTTYGGIVLMPFAFAQMTGM